MEKIWSVTFINLSKSHSGHLEIFWLFYDQNKMAMDVVNQLLLNKLNLINQKLELGILSRVTLK